MVNFNAAPIDFGLASIADPILAALKERQTGNLLQEYAGLQLGGAGAQPSRAQQLLNLGGAPAAPKLPAMVGGGGRMTMPVGTRGGQFDQIAPRMIADLQKDFQLTPEQAAGFVGNLGHESAGFGTLQEVKPMVPGSRGGFGYAQWTGPRRRAFEQYVQEKGLDPSSYEANYGFLRHELTATPEGNVLASLKQAPDAQTAARVVQDQFLRPGVPGTDSRMAWTDRALRVAGSNSQGAGPSSADVPAAGAQPVQQGFQVPGSPEGTTGRVPQAVPGAPVPGPSALAISPERRALLGKMLANPSTRAAALADIKVIQDQQKDATRTPESVQEFVWARRQGLTQATSPVEYAAEKERAKAKPVGSGMFAGNSVEGQGLNYLVETGQLTREQAAVFAAGKTITDPASGTIMFMTPQGLFSQKPGQPAAPVPVAPPGGADPTSGSVAPPQAAPAAGPLPPSNPAGLLPVTGAKPVAPDKLTQDEARNKGLNEVVQKDVPILMETFDALGNPAERVGDAVGGRLGGFRTLTSEKYQRATDALSSIAGSYLYSVSGAAASPEEIQRLVQSTMPRPGEAEQTRKDKRARVQSWVDSIKAKAGPAAQMPDGAKKGLDGKFYVPDPARPGKYLRVDS